jgi:hypothetical protein
MTERAYRPFTRALGLLSSSFKGSAYNPNNYIQPYGLTGMVHMLAYFVLPWLVSEGIIG